METAVKLKNGFYLSELIRSERKNKRMSQEKLGHAVGLSRVHINQIENDPDTASSLSFSTACQILAVLDIQLIAAPKPSRKNIEDIEQEQLDQERKHFPKL